MNLDERIEQLEIEANAHVYKLRGGMSNSTKPERIGISKKLKSFTAAEQQEVDGLISAYTSALGKSGVGNRRHGGMSSFYRDLVVIFFRFKKYGITLPRWAISKKHSELGLFDLLREHGYITDDISYEKFIKDTATRGRIHHNVERIFVRVADAIEQKPPQK